jgi:hypothetical protein
MKTSPASRRGLLFPVLVCATFWTIGVAMWLTSGYLQPLFLFGYIQVA